MRHRGFGYWGVQIGLFPICQADFAQNFFHFFTKLPTINNLLLSPEKNGLKLGKGNHTKVNMTQTFLNFRHSNKTICRLSS